MSDPEHVKSNRLAVLIFTDVVGSSEMKARLGTPAYAALIARHDVLFRQRLAAYPAAELLQDTGDGYFAAFRTVSDAVRFALEFQEAMHREPWGAGGPLQTRIGIHLGELAQISGEDNKPTKVVGMAADVASRLMSLARGGQILLTRTAFDEARQFIAEHPAANGEPHRRALRWMAHGDYIFQGTSEPVEVFEVGGDGIAPLAPPRDREKARRAVDVGKDEILGWRPAVGLNVPQTPAWVLERKLGEGTFGEVWLARHQKLKQNRVFKFCFDAERLESFKRELTLFRLLRDALGERADIARLYDVCLDKPPYFLESEFAPAGNLIDWAAAEGGLDRVPLATRLEIVAGVCDAVAAAHSVGVLHKDIKPSNILVHVAADRTPRPQLTDFGIGMLTDRAQLAARQITEVGFTMMPGTESSRSGTRIYAPPESLSGRPFTTQGDVYALGVLLYQMTIADLDRPLALGWERRVDDPLLREDIAACVDGDPERRINSAAEVGARLRRLPERRAERAAEAQARETDLRRRRLLRIGTAALAVSFAVASVTVFAYVQQQRLRSTRREAQWAHAATGLQQGIAAHFEGRVVESRRAFVGARTVLSGLGVSPIAPEVGLYRSFREYTDAVNVLQGHTKGLLAVAVFPDGVRACSAGEDGSIRLWDMRTGRELGQFSGHQNTVGGLAVSPNGTRLLSSGQDATIRLWDVDSRRVIRLVAEPAGESRSIAFSPDGTVALWATTNDAGEVRVLDLADPHSRPRALAPTRDKYYAVAFSPDGRRALATTYRGGIWVFDVAGARPPRRLLHPGKVLAAAFSPDGTMILSGSDQQTLKLSRVDGPEEADQLIAAHSAAVRGVAFVSGRNDLAASCSLDGTIKLWNLTERSVLRTYAGHHGGVRALATAGHSAAMLSAGVDRTARVWRVDAGDEVPRTREAANVTAIRASADGLTFLVGDESGTVTLRDMATLKPLRTFVLGDREIECAALIENGTRLVAADSLGACAVWDIASGTEVHRHRNRVAAVRHNRVRGTTWCVTAISPDGRFAVSSNEKREVMDVWSLSTGRLTGQLDPAKLGLEPRPQAVTCAAVSPDGRYALTGDAAKWMHCWDLASGRAIFSTPAGEPGAVATVSFSPDGKRALAAGYDPRIGMWDLAGGTRVGEFVGHTDITRSAAFGADGHTVFSAGSDGTVRMWDVATSGEYPLAARAGAPAIALDAVPGRDAALCAAGATVTLWDVSRSRRHLHFDAELAGARAAIAKDGNDARALATLGEWYAFRGAHDWAANLLARGRAGGATVSTLSLARCYWQTGRFAEATQEFKSALTRREASADYINLCLAAIEREASGNTQSSTARATTQRGSTSP